MIRRICGNCAGFVPVQGSGDGWDGRCENAEEYLLATRMLHAPVRVMTFDIHEACGYFTPSEDALHDERMGL